MKSPRPLKYDDNIKIKFLGLWIYTQENNYKNKKYIMLNQKIYNKWTEFINNPKYKNYF
jgi:hypothetical protein